MKRTPGSLTYRSGIVAALLAAAAAAAQPPASGGDRVSGAQLQSWLDQRFSYAGVHHPSQCVILNAAQGDARVLFMRCPNGWADKIGGHARVVGDTYCTTFPIPNTPGVEECVTWHGLGSGRFEQRKGGTRDTTVILLPQGLSPNP